MLGPFALMGRMSGALAAAEEIELAKKYAARGDNYCQAIVDLLGSSWLLRLVGGKHRRAANVALRQLKSNK